MGCGPSLPKDVALAYSQLPKNIDYNIHVKPILSDRCFACHGNDKNKLKAGLRLDNAKDAYGFLKENEGQKAIVPGRLSKSMLFHKVISEDPETMMPPPESNLSLKAEEIAILTKWIEQGAEYKDHWALLPPEIKPVEKIENRDWLTNEIDHYVLARLESKNWTPSSPAEKLTLLRRVSFDLTGLPPTLDEITDFENDKAENAFEKVVDRLLSSEAYGEHMAVGWMDLARFADTHGYTVDRSRDMSPWRDWVIQAYNDNMPYDEFVKLQLAGDLRDSAGREEILATAFNRNHQQNMEGGIVPEEFRVEYVADRVNTFGTAFLGLTVECARCHDHKYDPISQKEYYELYSFFNNVNEAGQISFDNAMPVPTLLLSDEETKKVIRFIDEKIATKRSHHNSAGFEKWLEANPSLDFEINKPIFHLDFDGDLGEASMKQQGAESDAPVFTEEGILLNGDSWVDLNGVGAFNKDQAFSVSISLKVPKKLKDGVIFHKGEGAALYNFRGFHLAIKDNQLEAIMARTTPDNAIIKIGGDVPRDRFIDLTFTYDGSSEARGLKVYLNGDYFDMKTKVDNLHKDILFFRKNEPGIQIGARWRGIGIKDAIVNEISVYDIELSAIEVKKSPSSERLLLKAYYDLNIDAERKEKEEVLYDLRRKKTLTIDTIQEIMVMKEMESPRQAYILERGIYNNYGEEVFPSAIDAVLPFSEDLPRNRLGLAEWLFDERNPLTARVAANRIWQQFFGVGIVKSADDFGNQGSMPSHPELLDFLAMYLRDSGWDQKALIKKIVMSSTYRQSSVLREELVAADLNNTYLWRGPSARLSAEMMRDNVLLACGLLVNKIGGPSVKPYQPEGLWSINGGKYDRDQGDDLYRRSLYTFWKRSVPNPSQAIFDAPNRSSCVVSRQKTSTPLQALVLMNDPAFVEAARVLAYSIAEEMNIALAISDAFTKLTGRRPSQKEIDLLVEMRDQEYAKFIQQPEKMKGWLKAGDYQSSKTVDDTELAANAVVASMIINADATIMKR